MLRSYMVLSIFGPFLTGMTEASRAQIQMDPRQASIWWASAADRDGRHHGGPLGWSRWFRIETALFDDHTHLPPPVLPNPKAWEECGPVTALAT